MREDCVLLTINVAQQWRLVILVVAVYTLPSRYSRVLGGCKCNHRGLQWETMSEGCLEDISSTAPSGRAPWYWSHPYALGIVCSVNNASECSTQFLDMLNNKAQHKITLVDNSVFVRVQYVGFAKINQQCWFETGRFKFWLETEAGNSFINPTLRISVEPYSNIPASCIHFMTPMFPCSVTSTKQIDAISMCLKP